MLANLDKKTIFIFNFDIELLTTTMLAFWFVIYEFTMLHFEVIETITF